MTNVNDLIDQILDGSASKVNDTFDTLVRTAIDAKVDEMRPAIHSSIFNAPILTPEVKEAAKETSEQYHVKFKDSKTGQWFKSKTFGSQQEMTQHFWAKIKPTAGEVQFHGPKGRIAENTIEELWDDADASLIEGRNDATFKMSSRKFKTKKFGDEAMATDFIERHPDYGIIGSVDGVIHVAKNKSKEIK